MAYFYSGFAFERDVHGNLTIEGRPVESDVLDDETLEQRAKEHLKESRWLAARERVRQEHLKELRKGREHWNKWRCEHPAIQPILTAPCFTNHDSERVLDGYDFSYTNFTQACLQGMSLKNANFHQAILAKTDLSGAHLEGSNFCRTDFYETNLSHAFLDGANLQGVQLAKTDLTDAHLKGCHVYGLSAWDLKLDRADQSGLKIHYDELVGGQRLGQDATVDGIDVASFMYFTINNKNIARIIEATTRQWVLLLGRFTVNKDVLEELATALRKDNLIPIIFDFERSATRDLIESIILLGGLSRLVIVDISDPQSTPAELHAIVPHFAVPVVPIIKQGVKPFGVFSGLLKFPWVRRPVPYTDAQQIASQLNSLIAETETMWQSQRSKDDGS